jgi:hypothetical protein
MPPESGRAGSAIASAGSAQAMAVSEKVRERTDRSVARPQSPSMIRHRARRAIGERTDGERCAGGVRCARHTIACE